MDIICEKGYIDTIAPILSKAIQDDSKFGTFILSFDYMDNKKSSCMIYTDRIVINRQFLIETLAEMKKKYGNYHLNYIIQVKHSFFDNDEIALIQSENSKYLKKHFELTEKGFIYNRIMVNNEAVFYNNLFRHRKLKDINYQWLFINDNVYRALITFIK